MEKTCIIQKIVWSEAAADEANEPRVFAVSVNRSPAFQKAAAGRALNVIGQFGLITFTAEWQRTERGN